MAPALVRQATGTGTVTNQTIAITASAAGNLMVLFVGRAGGTSTGALTSVTDSAGQTWTLATRGSVSGSSNTRIECWYRANSASITSVTFNSSTSQVSGWNVSEWSGIATVTPLDVASPDNSGHTSSATDATPAITTTNANDLILVATHFSLTTTSALTAGYTALTNFDDSAGSSRAAYRVVAATGSNNAQWTLGSSKAAGTITVAFKAGSSSVDAAVIANDIVATSIIPTPGLPHGATISAAPIAASSTFSSAVPMQYSANAAISLMALDFGQDASTYTTPLSAYQYVILSPSMYGTVASIRSANPTAKILVYKEIAATISGQTTADEAHSSTGVLYSDALANHPTWFLTKAGARFTFTDYTNAYWMDVGLQAYRDAWIANVKASVIADGFDGVYCDDANFYPGHGVAVDGLEKYTDAQYGAAMRDFLIQVGDAMHSIGKLASMNAGTDPWNAPAVALSLTAAQHMDVYMREFWMHWDNTTSGVFMDADFTSQFQQLLDVEAVTNIIVNTYPESNTDTLTIRYGRACFLLGWSGRAGSASQSRPVGLYNPYQPDAYRDIGSPKGVKYAVGVAWRRDFTGGTVIVNPSSTTSQVVNLGGTFINSSGASVSSVTVPLGDSAVLLTSVPAPARISAFTTIPTPTLPLSATGTPTRIPSTSTIPVPMFTSSISKVATPITGAGSFGSPTVVVTSVTSVLIQAVAIGYTVGVIDGGSPSSVLTNVLDGGAPAGTPYSGVLDGGSPAVAGIATDSTTVASFGITIFTSAVAIGATRVPGTSTFGIAGLVGGTSVGIAATRVPGTSTFGVVVVTAATSGSASGASIGATSTIPVPVFHSFATVVPIPITALSTIPTPLLSTATGATVGAVAIVATTTIPIPIFTSSVMIYPPSMPGNFLVNSEFIGGSTAGWTNPFGLVVLQDPTAPFGWCLSIPTPGYKYFYQRPLVFIANTTYTLSFWMRADPSTTSSGGAGVVCEGGGSSGFTGSFWSLDSAPPTSWTRYVATWTNGFTDTVNSDCLLTGNYNGAPGAGAVYIAGVRVEAGATASPNYVGLNGGSTIPAPFVQVAVNATALPSRVPGSTTILVPAFQSAASILPVKIGATSAVPTPVVGAGRGSTPVAPVILSTSSLPVPVFTSSAVIPVGRIGATVGVPVPVFTSPVGILPSAVAATSTFGVPIFTSSTVVLASRIGAAGTIPVPSIIVTGNVDLAASPIASTSTIPIPAIVAITQATGTPSRVPGTTSIPVPTFASQAASAASSVSGVASIPVAVVTSAVLIPATGILATSNFATPAVFSSAAVLASRIASPSSIPVPVFRSQATAQPVVAQASSILAVPVFTSHVAVQPSVVQATSSFVAPIFTSSAIVPASRVGAVVIFPTPSITVSGNVNLTAPSVAASSTIPAPAVVAVTQAQATPVLVPATTLIPVPVFRSQAASTAAVVFAITTIPTPIFTSSVQATAGGIQGTSNFATPAVFSAVAIQPSRVSALSTIPAPSVAAGGSVVATAGVLTVASSVPTPTIQWGTSTTAAAIVGITSIPVATIGTGMTVAAGHAAASTAVFVPLVTTTSTAGVTAAAILGLSALPVPALHTSQTATSSPIVVSSTLTLPSIQTGTGIFPAFTGGTAGFGAPTISVPARPSTLISTTMIRPPTVVAASNSMSAPVVVTGAGSFGAPAVQVGITVHPATVLGGILVPWPVIQVGFVPDTIMATTSFYLPYINRTTDERIRVEGRRGVLILFGTEPIQPASGRRTGTIISGREGNLATAGRESRSKGYGLEPGTL